MAPANVCRANSSAKISVLGSFCGSIGLFEVCVGLFGVCVRLLWVHAFLFRWAVCICVEVGQMNSRVHR